MARALSAEQVADFRHAVCDVAGALFASQGYDAVTMRAIAGELGVSAMTPYRYFPGKAAIYREVRLQAFVRFGQRVTAAAATEPEPLARLRALFRAYLGFALDEPGSYRIMFELAAPQDAEPDPADDAVVAGTWTPLLETLEQACRQGLVRGDPLTLANLCWVQVHGLASLHLAGRLRFERSYDELFEPLFQSLLHGILSRPDEDHPCPGARS